MKERMRCSGCGTGIQSTDATLPGYVPQAVLDRPRLICQRCYRIQHYNEVLQVSLEPQAYLEILHGIGVKQALVLHIVDFFDLEGSWIRGLHRFVGANPVWLVVNKADLLPRGTSLSRLKHRLLQQASIQGIKPEQVFLVSAKEGMGVEALLQGIETSRRGCDVYVVGATNVGKSSLINQLLRITARLSGTPAEDFLTTSPYPGTTLDTVRIVLPKRGEIIDTPGVIHRHRLTEYLLPRDLRAVVPDRVLHSRIYQLNAGQALFMGGLARIDFVKGARSSFVCYTAARVHLHRTKMEKADILYSQHLGELLQPPVPDGVPLLPPLRKLTLRLEQSQDVVISGLGWVAVKGEEGVTLDVFAPQGIGVVVRDCLL